MRVRLALPLCLIGMTAFTASAERGTIDTLIGGGKVTYRFRPLVTASSAALYGEGDTAVGLQGNVYIL
jgi:hypothetical protein